MNAQAHPSPLLVTAFNGRIFAYDRASGRTAWSFSVPGKSVPGVRPRPTHAEVHEGRVFVFAGGAEGSWTKRVFFEVHALDSASGHPLWSRRVDAGPVTNFSCATVLVEAGQVVISFEGVLAAFQADTGQPQFTRNSEHADGGIHAPHLQMCVQGARAQRVT
ncbi:PQQ-binding-like beta-propeller repeat protein [Comamonas sp. JC664]|uniref:outer membrane protein assembly factor BamB family protein n=1 Tax=Comamonas sp. JC664 TaxID=2801917 RepID=UPI00174CFEF8|nr:PQQ-binding-like beta-propeller repeat protein [Comamonas sp. JC664]MBL0692601.1 PQQ-binding-like beta-propeller repeat protein [Comamonas sp. JC664]GHG92828.1 hypothetical protein GCM10012319_54660 [Comamonas sp. KCTC 72670]